MMKVGLTVSALSLLLNSATAKSSSKSGLKKLLTNARRLDDNGNDGGDGNNDWAEEVLGDYSIKLRECHDGVSLFGDEDYPIYGAVVFRMCPTNSCDSGKKNGCTSGYADFAVDLGTFVAAMMDDQEDNMNWDDKYGDMANYAECAQYQGEDGGQYYLGPSCMGSQDVGLALFDDYTCATPSEASFADISNGWTLPYSDGGLVSTQCTSCYDDDGAVKELCTDLYDNAAYRCEEDWEIKHYYWNAITEVNKYGQDTTGCVTISRFNYSKPTVNVWAELGFAILLLLVAAAGWCYYRAWWEKEKQNLERIDTDDEEDEEDEDYHAHESDDEHDDGQPTGTMA